MRLATPRLWIPASVVFLAAALLTGALVGPVHLGALNVVRATFAHVFGLHSPLSGTNDAILWQLRLPRVVLGALVGGTLAAAGAAYQGVFRNPLADPYLLGAAAGAGLGVTIVIVSGHQPARRLMTADDHDCDSQSPRGSVPPGRGGRRRVGSHNRDRQRSSAFGRAARSGTAGCVRRRVG